MAASEKKMTRQEMGEFLLEPSIARIATINPDGSPHVTPIWFIYANRRVTFSIGKNTMKARNLSRDRVSLCVDESEHPNRTVLIQGGLFQSVKRLQSTG